MDNQIWHDRKMSLKLDVNRQTPLQKFRISVQHQTPKTKVVVKT